MEPLAEHVRHPVGNGPAVADGQVAALVRLFEQERDAYGARGDEAAKGWTTEAAFMGGKRTDPDQLRADLADKPGSVILTLRDNEYDRPFACVWLEPQEDDVWLLGMLAVDPGRQDGGEAQTGEEAHEQRQGE